MTSSDLTPAGDGRRAVMPSSQVRSAAGQDAGPPPRPTLADKAAAPVIVKLPPPFVVRVSQVFWVLSLIAGGAVVVYLFVIRLAQHDAIVDRVRAVDDTRSQSTYELAADIVFWSVFGAAVTLIAVQIVFLVSFNNRRPNTRWWLFGSLLVQAVVYLIAQELVAMGERGAPLQQLMRAEVALGLLGLVFSVMPPALRWTARRHDVRNSTTGTTPAGDL